jgi:enoyl-[acyl-carrier protein] reductase II
MLATMVLGAEGVQIGSRFVASIESSAHLAFKEAVVNAGEGDTKLTLKELAPVRLLNNAFYQSVQRAYSNNASVDQLKTLLGKGRARNGMFAGDLEEGELEIGQVSARIHEILPAEEIVKNIIEEYFALGSAKLGGYFSF